MLVNNENLVHELDAVSNMWDCVHTVCYLLWAQLSGRFVGFDVGGL